MSNGYGRGYYGENQLARPPRQGSGWTKVALVLGVGAVAWFLWPRRAVPAVLAEEPPPPSPPPGALDQVAQSRDYSSTRAYEDSVVASARQLQEAGARVVLAPHLAHLAPRLEPGATSIAEPAASPSFTPAERALPPPARPQ
jgi:hypothetical protein